MKTNNNLSYSGLLVLLPLAAYMLFSPVFSATPPPAGTQTVPEASPPPPPAVKSGEALDVDNSAEDVIIAPSDDTNVEAGSKVEAIKSNDQTRAVRITPKHGRSYYLLDSDGDGVLERRVSQLYSDPLVPSWIIFSWQ